jgi:hypothetical protein
VLFCGGGGVGGGGGGGGGVTPSQNGSPVSVYADGPRVSIGAAVRPVGHRDASILSLILFVCSRELSVASSCARCTECRDVYGKNYGMNLYEVFHWRPLEIVG